MKRREQLSKAKMSFDRKEKFQASYEQEKEKITSILKHVRQGGGEVGRWGACSPPSTRSGLY